MVNTPDTRTILGRLVDGRDLDRAEAGALMDAIMAGTVAPPRVAAILTALRIKGETVDEIAGFVTAMREKAVRITPSSDGIVDTCGTGGEGPRTFNISTATAFVAAGMGIPVAKHGNRAVSSRCGSADVLEALDVDIDVAPESVAELVDTVGLGFLFAPHHHPAMKHVAPVRRELGIRTVFNLLGPLTNPAGVKRQLIGVFREDLTEVVARVLGALGSEKVFVVRGRDGMDEVSVTGETVVSILDGGDVRTTTFVPEDAGVERTDLDALTGGTAEENATRILDILGGVEDPGRNAVVLNAAFVAVLGGKAADFREGAKRAREAIDSGAALDRLAALRDASHRLARGAR